MSDRAVELINQLETRIRELEMRYTLLATKISVLEARPQQQVWHWPQPPGYHYYTTPPGPSVPLPASPGYPYHRVTCEGGDASA